MARLASTPRRTAGLAARCALAVLALLTIAVPAAAQGSVTPTFGDGRLVLDGEGYRPGEQVEITVRIGDQSHSVVVVADRRGRFRLATGLRVPPLSAVEITARDEQGLTQATITTAPAFASDPAAVIEAYTAAINASDAEAAMAFVADDAVYLWPAGRFVGKEQVRGLLEGLTARGARIELEGDREVLGEYVRWTARVRFLNPGDGPAELRNGEQAIVHRGAIVFHMASPAP